jgi:hypothetical protein
MLKWRLGVIWGETEKGDGRAGREDLHGVGVDMDVANLGVDEVRLLALELRAVLRAREEQLERLLEESASLREVAKQLQVRPTTQ